MSPTSGAFIDGKPVSFRLSNETIEYEFLEAKQTSSLPLNSIITTLQSIGKSDDFTRILFLDYDSQKEEAKLRTFEGSGLPVSLRNRNPFILPAHLKVPPNGTSNVHVVISTHSGTRAAPSFFKGALQPLLSEIGVADYHIHTTESEHTIIELSKSIFLPRAQAGIRQTIILLSGDGGLVDIIKVFSAQDEHGRSDENQFEAPSVSLIPMGTGNATANSTGLVRDATWGLSTLLRGEPRRLPLFRAALSPGAVYVTDEGRRREPILHGAGSIAEVYGAVVLSWGMHASLVADSDTNEYRKFGAQRFQMAAKELLHPSDGSPTHQYCGRVRLIKIDPVSGVEKEELVKRSKHMYVLTTLMSQLEKGFTISPASNPLDGQLRIVHFGPLDPDDAMNLMTKAYQGGQHVEEDAVGYEAVEGVRIRFDEEEERWRRVCVDGKIVAVERGGWLEIRGERSRRPGGISDTGRSMLVTPRTYQLSQTPNKGLSLSLENYPTFRTLRGWSIPPEEIRRAAEMLLIHQVGSVHIGEVVRYTLTYTPSADRILPHPTELYVKIRNTSAIALRAAYLHGPYTIHTACYPSTFDPNSKTNDHKTEGIPQFEPHVQPGAAWDAVILVPERVRDGASGSSTQEGVSWIIEISSQIVFSNTASVNYEVLVGRDAKSTELGAASIADLPAPGSLRDFKRSMKERRKGHVEPVKGVYSESVKLVVHDTAALWTSPRFPSWEDKDGLKELDAEHTENANLNSAHEGPRRQSDAPRKDRKRKKVHFVVLTHGLHSNLGADMLYMKESIDAASRQARHDRKKAREERKKNMASSANAPLEESDSDDEEEVIVRGFPGNSGRTERGIQYLGKRLAKYVLLMTYPDQPYLPIKNTRKMSLGHTLGLQKGLDSPKIHASHSGSTIYRREPEHKDYAYQITSISFIGHSLGGLVQTYAIAYIQKHSPEFFDFIKPVNFVALASPFLGLSNENPIYIKLAFDFGLVGRTGQDLGLSWSAPSKMRSGWEAMIGGLGTDANKSERNPDPGAKPLLRILPSGPAHQVLKKFKNRTLYCNVVNDGIVPLRTSCLLFLDWRGLERVEKARRENGLVGTVAEWSWAALTGASSSQLRAGRAAPVPAIQRGREEASKSPTCQIESDSDNNRLDTTPELPAPSQFLTQHGESETPSQTKPNRSTPNSPNPFTALMTFFKFQKNSKESKAAKIYKRSQTIRALPPEETSEGSSSTATQPRQHGRARGDSLYDEGGLYTPPKTTLFEAAGDVISPPLPSLEYLLDPSSRPRTIFHDRVYHPNDIPPPPPVKPRSIFRVPSYNGNVNGSPNGDRPSQSGSSVPSQQTMQGSFPGVSSGMKVEEKIARAYHREVTWRKVLVRLEPDAHNNIIVRRMFANAYGWPVVKHLVDTHFAYTRTATTADEKAQDEERALPLDKPSQVPSPTSFSERHLRTESNNLTTVNSEEHDTVPEMLAPSRLNSPRLCASPVPLDGSEEVSQRPPLGSRASSLHSKLSRDSSAQWTDRYLEDGDDDDYSDEADGYDGLRENPRRSLSATRSDVGAPRNIPSSVVTAQSGEDVTQSG
ncbi:conserved hypothetical protein [Uncinocarpus reesii 1704]|uniref:DAGKc domain-containing protein n=1 Tax=Uncinocarpus reesii (strain UAMH 1704) TaxID=336963 RepID=C4JGQ1_UNCRE|nr:uncharacterized protein UREG_02563 [Uncinocarpus reesii 1704]EEP77714.1 conserved hypothetical protein [Uncinocarpus reesii 1704]